MLKFTKVCCTFLFRSFLINREVSCHLSPHPGHIENEREILQPRLPRGRKLPPLQNAAVINCPCRIRSGRGIFSLSLIDSNHIDCWNHCQNDIRTLCILLALLSVPWTLQQSLGEFHYSQFPSAHQPLLS